MRALVFNDRASAGVTDWPDPAPGPAEVLLAVEAAGVCHTDLDILHGRYPANLPVIPGREFAGTVLGFGADVHNVQVGERVAVDPLVSCGRCRNCERGRRNLCREIQAYGADRDGGMAQRAVVAATNLHPVGDLAPELAALAEPLGCACHGIGRAAPGPQDRVLLFGAGPIGLLLAVVLHARGVRDLTVVDVFEDRLDVARQFGATQIVRAGPDLAARVGDQRFDLVIDATGRPDVVQAGVGFLHNGRTLLIFGVCPPGSALQLDPNEVYARELRVIGSFSLNGTLDEGLSILRSTELPIASLISETYSLADADAALSRVGARDSLKIQVHPGR